MEFINRQKQDYTQPAPMKDSTGPAPWSVMSSWCVVHRYNELQNQRLYAGTHIIEPLAVPCEYGMTYYGKETIRNLVSLL